MTIQRVAQISFLSLALLASAGCIIHVGGDHDYDDKGGRSQNISHVLGGIDIDDNRNVGDLSSVNGEISLRDHVTAKELDTVNGGIELGNEVSIVTASTVNGSIEAGKQLKVATDLSTVNGDIELAEGAEVGGNITTVNGDIELTQSHISGYLETKNGDIQLAKGTVVDGDIIFRAIDKHRWSSGNEPPTLTIDSSSGVGGQIILHRKVTLQISNQALKDKIVVDYDNEQ